MDLGLIEITEFSYFCDVRNYFLTPTTNIPHGCIGTCK